MDENYNTTHSVSYEGVSPARALSGITNFYDEGIKPKGNVSYSLSVEGDNKVLLNDIAEDILDYDVKNGTELYDWLNFIENGEIGNNKTQFFIAIAGEILSKYGIKGNINVSRRAVNRKKHTNNEDHNLGVKEWADVVLTINDPIIITRYNNEPNAYRVYTLALINGKNICVGVDVTATNGVEITKISTAFGRDIRKVQSSKVEEVLYDKESEKAEEQISGSDNSHLYAQQPFDNKDTASNPKNQISEQDSFSLSREQEDIERVAKENGTWLKAPNGKGTNLSPEQWVSVRTKAFKEWFGDWENDPENASKVVDENGEPRVMHHGSSWRPLQETDGRAVFNMEDGALGKGAYFTSAFPEAADYARDSLDNWDLSEDEIDDDGYVTDVFLNVRDDAQILRDNAYGNDSFIVVATSPNQIKSATENIGTFDSANDDIRYSLNRDDVTIATPEMEAEANEELSREAMLLAQLDEAQSALPALSQVSFSIPMAVGVLSHC